MQKFSGRGLMFSICLFIDMNPCLPAKMCLIGYQKKEIGRWEGRDEKIRVSKLVSVVDRQHQQSDMFKENRFEKLSDDMINICSLRLTELTS